MNDTRNKEYVKMLDNIIETETEVKIEIEVDPSKALVIREYQQDMIDKLISAKRYLCLDAPGLGKTLEAAIAAVHLGEPILVVAPVYLVEQWTVFLEKQFPTLRISLCDGPALMRMAGLLMPADIYVVNYEMLRTFPMPRVGTIIFDESHRLRRRSSQVSKKAAELAEMIPNVFLLTATPIKREPDDLFWQLHCVAPRTFTSYWNFVDTYCKTSDYGFGTKIYGARNLVSLRKMFARYAWGRTYKEVGRFLPEVISQNIYVKGSKAFMKKYDDLKSCYIKPDGSLAESPAEVMHGLRRMTSLDISKIGAVKELVDDLVETGKKVIVYCWYHDTAEALRQILDADTKITGAIKPWMRASMAKEAKHVAVGTIASMSEGVDFSDARVVVFVEEDHVYGSNYQALTRVQRDRNDGGEDKEPVLAYHVMMKDTIDVAVHRTSQQRGGTIDDVLKEALH